LIHHFSYFTSLILLVSSPPRQILEAFHEIFCHRKRIPNVSFAGTGARYCAWKNGWTHAASLLRETTLTSLPPSVELITMERYLLKELGFSFYQPIEHPHKYLLYYVKVVPPPSPPPPS
jgi:hypothetical protein